MKWSNLNIGGKIAIGFVMVLLLIFGLGVTDFSDCWKSAIKAVSF